MLKQEKFYLPTLDLHAFSVLSLQLENYGGTIVQPYTYQLNANLPIPLVFAKRYKGQWNNHGDNPLLRPTTFKFLLLPSCLLGCAKRLSLYYSEHPPVRGEKCQTFRPTHLLIDLLSIPQSECQNVQVCIIMSIPQSGGGNVKTFRRNQRPQIQKKLFRVI